VRYQLKFSRSKAQNITAKLLLRWPVPVVIAKIMRPNVVLATNPDAGVIVMYSILQFCFFVFFL